MAWLGFADKNGAYEVAGVTSVQEARLEPLMPTMGRRAGRQALIPARWLASYGRQAEPIWHLAGLACAFCPLALVGPWAWLAVGCAGVILLWELAGRVASHYAEVAHPELKREPRTRARALARFLVAMLGFLTLATLPAAWLGSDSERAIGNLLIALAVVGSWLAWHLFQKGWRLGYALVAMISVTVVSGLVVGSVVSFPAMMEVGYFLLWVRLVTLFLLVAVLELWVLPVGEKTYWGTRLVRLSIVSPILAVVVTILLGSASWLPREEGALPYLFFALWGVVVMVLGLAWRNRWIRSSGEWMRFWRGLRDGRGNPARISPPFLLGAVPALLLAPVAATGPYVLSLLLFLAYGVLSGRERRETSAV